MALLDPIFTPLLKLPVLPAVIAIAFLISLIINLAYMFFTDQKEMKELKDKLKEFQKRMKEHSKEPEKMMSIQKESMEVNMKYMMKSMKPTLFTFIPIVIIFGWLNAHFAFAPIHPGMEFTSSVVLQDGVQGYAEVTVPEQFEVVGDSRQEITGNIVRWSLRAKEPGEYFIDYKINDETQNKDILVSQDQEYLPAQKAVDSAQVKTISIDQPKLIVLNLLGWKLGWLGTYILCSLVFSMSLRKIMRLH